jgi:hypothetical protein
MLSTLDYPGCSGAQQNTEGCIYCWGVVLGENVHMWTTLTSDWHRMPHDHAAGLRRVVALAVLCCKRVCARPVAQTCSRLLEEAGLAHVCAHGGGAEVQQWM